MTTRSSDVTVHSEKIYDSRDQELLADEWYVMEEGIIQQLKGSRQPVVLSTEELQQFILCEYHVNCDHCGFNKTLAAVSSHYTWKGIAANVKGYVNACHVCATQKHTTRKRQGLLQALPPPSAQMQQ
eukprot:scaffold316683_cov24-Tisochrysis_lutea.AAC.1